MFYQQMVVSPSVLQTVHLLEWTTGKVTDYFDLIRPSFLPSFFLFSSLPSSFSSFFLPFSLS